MPDLADLADLSDLAKLYNCGKTRFQLCFAINICNLFHGAMAWYFCVSAVPYLALGILVIPIEIIITMKNGNDCSDRKL